MVRPCTSILSPVAVFLATIAGIIAINNGLCLAVESTGLDNFHFFQSPPEANDMKMVTVDDATVKLSDFRGKVVLLNFWRQNCRYCQQEKEYLKELISELKSKDFTVLCVDFWDQPAWVKSYAKKNPGDLVLAFQPSGFESVMENVVKGRLQGYFVLNEAKEAIYEVRGFPSTYVLDKEGKVVAAHLGMGKWNDPIVVKWLSSLVAPSGAPFSPADLYYELPAWMDRILSSPGTTEKNSAEEGRQSSPW